MFGINKIIPSETNISFMDYRKKFIILSIFFILCSILLLTFKGLNLGIDFKGGTLIEINTKNSNISELRSILSSKFNDVHCPQRLNNKFIIYECAFIIQTFVIAKLNPFCVGKQSINTR